MPAKAVHTILTSTLTRHEPQTPHRVPWRYITEGVQMPAHWSRIEAQNQGYMLTGYFIRLHYLPKERLLRISTIFYVGGMTLMKRVGHTYSYASGAGLRRVHRTAC